jgi:HEAT repeat protein
MRARTCFVIWIGSLVCAGCKTKSTDELIGNLKSGQARERIAAVRLLPQRQEATRVVPALIGSLKDKVADVRWSAAIGLGYYGIQAKEAIPALQVAEKDRDARVREGARMALSRIDPNQFPLGGNEDPYKKRK